MQTASHNDPQEVMPLPSPDRHPDLCAVATLRPMKQVKLAKTGDAEKRMILCEVGLKVDQEAGLGLIADLSTS